MWPHRHLTKKRSTQRSSCRVLLLLCARFRPARRSAWFGSVGGCCLRLLPVDLESVLGGEPFEVPGQDVLAPLEALLVVGFDLDDQLLRFGLQLAHAEREVHSAVLLVPGGGGLVLKWPHRACR